MTQFLQLRTVAFRRAKQAHVGLNADVKLRFSISAPTMAAMLSTSSISFAATGQPL